MSLPTATPWLSRFAAFTAAATLGLIALGGLVTSHGAGMAVPDWPTTYGYNMFLFPVSQWVGGVFYEHTHRLWASAVGLLTVMLAVGLHLRSADRRLVRLGGFAVALVTVQGVLGGLRVNLMRDQIGVLHAGLAQAFLVLVTWIAIASSRWWHRWTPTAPSMDRGTTRLVTIATVAIFAQLLVGATMRHQHAGLAVPDFPLAYGRIWPATDEAFLQRINALRTDARDFHPITAFQVYAHMAHRILGVTVAALVIAAAVRLRRARGGGLFLGRLSVLWASTIGLQVLLGAATIWTNKAADIATAHVVVGAVCLGLGALATAACRVGKVTVPASGQTSGAPGAARGDLSPVTIRVEAMEGTRG